MTLPNAMPTLPHALDRTLVIRARPETVFRFFTDEKRWAAWWGAGSTIDPRPGGEVRIRYPDGTRASGQVVEISSAKRLVFTYGYEAGTLIPPGGSRVTIRLEPHEEGTQLHLVHEFADATTRDHHVQGWRYQLSVFSNIVADEVNSGASDRVDGWFNAWGVTDDAACEEALSLVVAPTVQFRDRFSAIDGLRDLVPHISAAQHHMPGLRLERKGPIRHCQGAVLAEWSAVSSDGQQRAGGTNLFMFGLDGRIVSVIGFWNS